ncbi:DNA topology modulation protein [Bacillus pinisoli]|uniref:DNA topology modulation protein n=1 Tax=Bacillus pinisoli TaxID=2901866 RepID=UPI001FF3DADA|nr:DNA topology modulation protein [Bacillus pinisoli]
MKIMIIGSSGAGKSTLARLLGEQLPFEITHLDAHYWKENWRETPRDEWIAWQETLMEKESWIIDGNYGSTMDIRLKAADVIIFLDYSRWVCLWSVIKRRFMYHGKTRPDMGKGCPEKLDWEFLKWVYDFPREEAPGIRQKLKEVSSDKKVYHLRHRRELAGHLHQIKMTYHQISQ